MSGPGARVATAAQRMGYLMAPGERPELIAIALPRRLQEADRGVVHGEGVGAERPGVPLNEDET